MFNDVVARVRFALRRAEEQQRTYMLNMDFGTENDRRGASGRSTYFSCGMTPTAHRWTSSLARVRSVATCELVYTFLTTCRANDDSRRLKVVEETIARRPSVWSVSNQLTRRSSRRNAPSAGSVA